MTINESAKLARQASIKLAAIEGDKKNKALQHIALKLEENSARIQEANEKDMKRAEEEALGTPLLKRLKFDDGKIKEVAAGITSLMELEEPVGKVQLQTELDEGLLLTRVATPIGVIGVIFESRPDALVQISTLCLKSGNAVLLKGGSEAKETNRALYEVIRDASYEMDMPEGWITLVESRDEVSEMLKMNKEIDLLIPRGSNEFVSYIMKNSDIPVMGHADGICHSYVDESADLAIGVKVVTDSKAQYVSVCNALETLLVHEKIAAAFLPKLKESLDAKGVEIRGCDKVSTFIACEKATEEDWKTEYLDYILSIKIVSGIDEAIEHINTYGSGHTDSIVATNPEAIEKFMNLVDSGNVSCNVSTRFSDGFRYGFGAEVGVSTSKIHARGPVGLEGLLIYKYKLVGNGHIVDDYATGKRAFTHRKIK
ncbi:MAG: glutamate-5-semialdehyde dehydrogenase [Cellulosilyticaceae bacterium]